MQYVLEVYMLPGYGVRCYATLTAAASGESKTLKKQDCQTLRAFFNTLRPSAVLAALLKFALR